MISSIQSIVAEWKAAQKDKTDIREQLTRVANFEEEAHVMEQYAGGAWGHVRAASDWLEVLKTRQLRRRATRLGVSFPSQGEPGMYDFMEWDDDHEESAFLTESGYAEVRRRIREEEKYRREVWGFWIASLTGLLGTLIGVLSLL